MRDARAKSTRIYKRTKLSTRPGLKNVRDAFAALYRKYNFEPRSGLTSFEFFDECEASVKGRQIERGDGLQIRLSRFSTRTKASMVGGASTEGHEYHSRDRAPARTPSRGRRAQKEIKRSAAFAGLHPLSHAPRANSHNAQFAMFNETMMTMWHTRLQS